MVSSSSSSSSSDSEAEGHAAAQKKARDEILNRKRQWATVGSDDDDDDDDSAAAKKAKRERKRSRKEAKKEHKKEKKSKKEKKKKKKKEKKKEKKKGGAMQGACDQDEFGKYGIVREADYFRKTREFEAWCAEVKKLPAFTGAKRELIELFLEYAEDYNTATMPHEKYYDLDKWEMAEYERAKAGKSRKRSDEVQTEFNDEALLERERRAERDRRDRIAEEADARASAKRMGADKLQALKEAEILKQKQQLAHKRGDLETVRKIDRILKASDVEVSTGF